MSILTVSWLRCTLKDMYLGVDIGGTKTLAAVLDNHGVILQKTKIPTNHDYSAFIAELTNVIKDFGDHDYRAAGVGMPVSDFDRKHGIGIAYGNLPWVMVPIQDDLEQLTACPVALENDAKLAALSEAMLRKDRDKVLYVTISTGIGIGLVSGGVIDPNFGDAGGANLLLTHHGTLMPWEHFASGKAIVERFGKRAEDIHDAKTWHTIVHDWTRGFLELIALTEPDVIVIGGSVGSYFDRYSQLLSDELKHYQTPLLRIPPFEQASRPEEAVVYGCYDYAKQQFGAPARA